MLKNAITVAFLGLLSFYGTAQGQMAPAAGSAQPAALTMGSPAPKLEVGKWIKGEPVKEFEKGKVYVLDFWATWCGPCRQSMPHLTELQKKYKDVVFIAPNVFEEEEGAVAPFVATMGDRMDLRVVLDDKSKITEGAMSKSWLTAIGDESIPRTFVIDKEQRVAWIGRPSQLEPVLEAVLKGTYDIENAKKVDELARKLDDALMKRDVDTGLKLAEQMAALDPTQKDMMLMVRLQLSTVKKDFAEAGKRAKELGDSPSAEPELRARAAYVLLANPNPDTDLALKLANQANDKLQSKSPMALSVLAMVHNKKGDKPKAIELQKKAIELSVDPQEKAFLERGLAEFEGGGAAAPAPAK